MCARFKLLEHFLDILTLLADHCNTVCFDFVAHSQKFNL